jgi:cytochrome b pre-mRNA-processing protein 3
MRFFASHHKRQATTGTLYLAIVAQARQVELYRDWLVPDTVEGRFELVALHTWLVLRRLRHAGKNGAAARQALLDYMFGDFDRSIREIGVGDISIGKYMKRLGKSFYGRAAIYDKCLETGDSSQLAEAARRNILGTAEADPALLDEASRKLAAYIAECDRAMALQSVDDIVGGRVAFIPVLRVAA